MLLTPQVSLEIAFAGWSSILVAYIIMSYLVEDDYEHKNRK
jgi:uncharacterized protein (UPF0333 family)